MVAQSAANVARPQAEPLYANQEDVCEQPATTIIGQRSRMYDMVYNMMYDMMYAMVYDMMYSMMYVVMYDSMYNMMYDMVYVMVYDSMYNIWCTI